MLERLLVIWCPGLLEEGPRGEEARRFARVVDRASELCPWAHPVRLGVCALPARGPARFFGGEEAVVSRLAGAVEEVEAQASSVAGAALAEPSALLGVADGLFAAVLAARSEVIVPTGGTAAFLAPFSVATLGRPDLAVTLQRLGVTSLGQLAALPAASISDRFGADAAACHAVARGESGELPGLRDRAVTRRLRVARGEDPDLDGGTGSGTGSGTGVRPTPVQPGFFGGASEADVRAARSFVQVQERLGIDAVLVGRLLQGGGATRPANRGCCPGAAPRWSEVSARAERPARSERMKAEWLEARRGPGGCRHPRRATCCRSRPGLSSSTPKATPWW